MSSGECQLTRLADGMVPVYTTDTGEKVVNGRELWQAVQSRREFATWVKNRLFECDARESIDYEVFDKFVKNPSLPENANEKVFHKSMKNPSGGRPVKDYIIKLATAKEMAMLERNVIGKSVRKYFISVEEKYQAQRNTGLDATMLAAIQAAVSETIRQLLPMLRNVPQNALEASPDVAVQVEETIKARWRENSKSKISRAGTEVRQNVEKMLSTRQYTYENICEYLAKHGIDVSIASVHRYAKMMPS